MFLLLPQLIFADDKQEVLAKFVITDATQNGEDVTQTYLENQAYLVFYTSGKDKSLCMANFWPKNQGVAFIVKIIPENLDILIYKGYMEGSVDFNSYD